MNDALLKELATMYSDKILPPYDTFIELLGYDGLCRMSDFFGGSTLYIPTKKRIFSGCFAEAMKKEYNGRNLKELAKKYEVCERTARYTVTGKKTWGEK